MAVAWLRIAPLASRVAEIARPVTTRLWSSGDDILLGQKILAIEPQAFTNADGACYASELLLSKPDMRRLRKPAIRPTR